MKINDGLNSIVVSLPDSQSRGTGFDSWRDAIHPRGSPSLLYLWGWQIGTDFSWETVVSEQ